MQTQSSRLPGNEQLVVMSITTKHILTGEVSEFMNAFVEAYPDDLDRFNFADELIQFAKFARKHVRDKKPGIII